MDKESESCGNYGFIFFIICNVSCIFTKGGKTYPYPGNCSENTQSFPENSTNRSKNPRNHPKNQKSPGLTITETVKRQAAEDQAVAEMNDSYCFKGHKMIWLDKNPYKNAIAVKCDKCFKHINVQGYYFNCSTCQEDFCKKCINTNRGS